MLDCVRAPRAVKVTRPRESEKGRASSSLALGFSRALCPINVEMTSIVWETNCFTTSLFRMQVPLIRLQCGKISLDHNRNHTNWPQESIATTGVLFLSSIFRAFTHHSIR